MVMAGKAGKAKDHFRPLLLPQRQAHVPQALLEQLADGGRLVIPVGEQVKIKYLKVNTREW